MFETETCSHQFKKIQFAIFGPLSKSHNFLTYMLTFKDGLTRTINCTFKTKKTLKKFIHNCSAKKRDIFVHTDSYKH